MNKKIKLIAAAIAMLLVAGIIIFFVAFPSSDSTDIPPVQDKQEQDVPASAQPTVYSEAELRKMVNDIAKERFGDDAFIIFLSTEGPSEIEIDGVKRKVYIYAADSASAHKQSGNVRGLYHVDADTAEIFDNGSGNMEKVVIGG